ncbi:MAG: hypothetical protein AAES65_09040 [Candidatus Thiodiazotropha sp. (ex. Lucinoma kazani)]
MSLTSRDIEEIEREPFKEPRFTGFFVSIVRLLMEIPPFKKAMSESVGGLSGSIFRCWESKDYEKAAKLAIHALEKYRNRKSKITPYMDHHNWWSFMKHGVDSAKHIENEECRNKLIEYASTGIEPYEGYDVAYSYLEFSRWMYQLADYDKAVEYAKIASVADNTWAEPDFILGWYGLLLGKGKAEEYLSRAVEKDQRVLFRIASNDVCKQYPHILNKLKQKYHAESEASPNQ